MMPTTKMYEERAVEFDPNSYPLGWENPITITDFIEAANAECHSFLGQDWYVESYSEENRWIVIALEEYKGLGNLQPKWIFQLTADPVDDDETQWIVFDVIRYEPTRLYNFQLP